MHFENMGFWGLVLLALDVWAVVSVIQSSSDTPKKVGWIVLILVLPLAGFIIWAFFGPRAKKA